MEQPGEKKKQCGGQVCRVPANLATNVCAYVRGSARGADLRIWGLVWIFLEHLVFTALGGGGGWGGWGVTDDNKRPVKSPKSAPGLQKKPYSVSHMSLLEAQQTNYVLLRADHMTAE